MPFDLENVDGRILVCGRVRDVIRPALCCQKRRAGVTNLRIGGEQHRRNVRSGRLTPQYFFEVDEVVGRPLAENMRLMPDQQKEYSCARMASLAPTLVKLTLKCTLFSM